MQCILHPMCLIKCLAYFYHSYLTLDVCNTLSFTSPQYIYFQSLSLFIISKHMHVMCTSSNPFSMDVEFLVYAYYLFLMHQVIIYIIQKHLHINLFIFFYFCNLINANIFYIKVFTREFSCKLLE